jgi:hypothetical protein
MGAQLSHDVAAMALDGLDADVEHRGDDLVAAGLGQQLNDQQLARGQGLGPLDDFAQPMSARRQVAAQHGVGDPRAEVGLVVQQRGDGGDDVVGRGRLQHEAARAGAEHLAHQLLAVVHGEDQQLGMGLQLADVAGDDHAAQIGHADVEDHDVRHQLLGQANGVAAVRGLATDGPTRLRPLG